MRLVTNSAIESLLFLRKGCSMTDIAFPIRPLTQLQVGSSMSCYSHNRQICQLSNPTTHFWQSMLMKSPNPITKLQGSTTVSDIQGDGTTILTRIVFLLSILLQRLLSSIKLVSPDPVPPDIEQLTTSPFRLSHPSNIRNNLYQARSPICLPSVQRPRTQLLEESSFPVKKLELLYISFLAPLRTSSTTYGDRSAKSTRGRNRPSGNSLLIE